jgi:voltage-gated potassium channel
MKETGSGNAWRQKLHEVIFEADTPAGKWFDVLLILAILVSVVLVMLDSVGTIQKSHGSILLAGEWFFTILFTIEYLLRLVSVGRPLAYATSSKYTHSGSPVSAGYPDTAGTANFPNS